jgi:putative membrane protein
MGVGFAVARFGLFLREMRSSVPSLNVSVPSGVALVALGVAVNVYATARHIGMVNALRNGSWEPGQISRGAIALALLLAAIGVVMAIYLLVVR